MTNEDLAQVADDVLEHTNRERQALRLLLDREQGRSGQILVQKSQMGSSETYIGAVTLEWLASRVRFAGQLALFKETHDPESFNVTIDAETINEIQQRPLNWSRQAPMAIYLAVMEHHKFPSVLVVITRDWVDDLKGDEWDSEHRAIQSAAEFTPLDSEGRIGLLDVSAGVSIYALDGQHRLMGTLGLMDLIKKGSLARKKKDGKEAGLVTSDELVKTYNITDSELQSRAHERIGIEFISAVMPGETRLNAKQRVRTIFVHVNRMASSLTSGQQILLDEDDGFSIVARECAATHPLLADKEGRLERVNWQSNTVPAGKSWLTTLQTLKEMSEGYLKADPRFGGWERSEKDLVPLRPSDDSLAEGDAEFRDLLDRLAMLPSYAAFNQGEDIDKIRRFSHEDGGKGHMLFRPIGQIVLAQALGELIFDKKQPKDGIFQKLADFDSSGAFNLDERKSVWWGILYDPGKKRMASNVGRGLAARLLVYMLGGGIQDDTIREKLREDFASARELENITIDLNENEVAPATVQLPPPL